MLNGNRTKSGRKRSPRDLYITPIELAEAAMTLFLSDERLTTQEQLVALDAGCGTGVWGDVCQYFRYIVDGTCYFPAVYGVDIEPKISLENSSAYMEWWEQDFLTFQKKGFNLIFGNPPYSLAEEFIRHSLELVNDNGYVYFLLRLSFLEGIKRNKGLFKEFPIKRVYVCARRPSFFSSDGKRNTTDTLAYAMFLWQKNYKGETRLSSLNWEYDK